MTNLAQKDSDKSETFQTIEKIKTDSNSEFNFMAGINDKKKQVKNIDS